MTTESPQQGSVWLHARAGILWSIVKVWGNRFMTFFIAIFLARLLSPEEFGIASTSALVVTLVPMIAGGGYASAIIQRRDLKPYESNLPFYYALTVGAVLLITVMLLSGRIEEWTKVENIHLYVSVAVGSLLISLPTAFQEAFYKRNMMFKTLAVRTLASGGLGGLAAVAAAFFGFGVWSFLVQIYVSATISAIWLWRRPQWVPGLKLDLPSFRSMSLFGLPIVLQRLNDYAGTRLIDFLIITNIGVAAYGVYTVGSRLYQLFLELLQRMLYDVTLSTLSRIADDRERTGVVYLKTITLSSSVLAPIFVMAAALSPELTFVLFGQKWAGVEDIAMPLLLLGSVQSVQHMNGAFLTARGAPGLVLTTGVLKTVLTLIVLLLFQNDDVVYMTYLYVGAQIAVAPVSFFVVWTNLRVSPQPLAGILVRAFAICAATFMVVRLLRPYLAPLGLWQFVQMALLGLIFGVVYIALLWLFDRATFKLLTNVALQLIPGRKKKKPQAE